MPMDVLHKAFPMASEAENLHILLVDDDSVDRANVRRVLAARHAHISLTEASSAELIRIIINATEPMECSAVVFQRSYSKG